MKAKILIAVFVIASLTTLAARVSRYTPPSCSVTISNVETTAAYCQYWDDGTITITASCSNCTGTLEYSINNGATFQSSNEFSGLSSGGTYNIIVRDYGNTACSRSWSGNPVSIGYLQPIITLYRDQDEDGYGTPLSIGTTCAGDWPWGQIFGYVSNDLDCDDFNAAIYPGTEGCNTACSMTVNAGADENLYFGYAPDQCATRTAAVTGGTAPYTYSWSLNRSLLLNVGNDAGDETMSGASTATVTFCLLDLATLTLSVTDANGCTASDEAIIYGEDVRCFKGNVAKVTICHATGNTKSPWTKICVDEEAVDAHLAHGDYLGACSPRMNAEQNETSDFDISLFPNPAQGNVIVAFTNDQTRQYELMLLDVAGRIINSYRGSSSVGENKRSIDLKNISSGIYQLMFMQDNKLVVKKLVVE